VIRARGSALLRRLLALEQIRYLLVGAWNTLVGYVLFAGLVITLGDRVHYLWLLLVAHVISVLQAFALYRVFVFRVRGRLLGDLVRFWSVYAGALAINMVALPVLVEAGGVPVLPAQAFFVCVTIVTTYVVNRHFSFSRPAAAEPPSEIAAGADDLGRAGRGTPP
jgi:putative flippase GtrA